jgi:adenylate cyclase
MVRQNLRGPVGESFEDMGEQSLKNIERKVRVWRWPAVEGNQAGASQNEATEQAENIPPTIEVLPFETLSSEPDHRFYAEGFTEDIATAISKLDALRVISVGSDEGINAARFHVKGSVRIAGERIRCNVQFIEVADGHHLWSEKFDGQVAEIFDFQDRITNEMVAAVEVELTEGEQVKLWHREAGNPAAYEDFVRGRTAYKEYSRTGNARARPAYEAALDKSPAFLSAAVGLARTHIGDATFGWSADREQSMQEARRVLDGVFAIDPHHAFAHMELAHVLMVEGDFPAARLEAELAVALDPNNSDAHAVLAHILNCLDLPEEALRSARRAISLNPDKPEFYFMPMAEAFIALERYQEANAVSEQIIARRPAWSMARISNVLALHGQGKEEEAREAVRSLLDISPGFTAGRWHRFIFYPDRADVPDLIERLVSVGLPR